ncbi:MAG: spermidine synthase [Candidatus Dormibacteraeota bacterium]|uniref:Spermidine synthase n=2 Tax=Candidatus Dormibacteria TaxID=3126996 RepID=A0A934MYJ8_9BACT|nr:spermidine synthase [Candidatus Dormibacteraeota bacterium]MBJ7601608.1 spermidine synthase [Candidatus Dormibacteraeota bacterium]MBJ7605546.1 spermidine synthase [Candidatus Dormibacteraeota bacterium]
MAAEPPPPSRARLVLLSFLMLFVELALIRWSGANVLYLSYFSNFVLLASFLGIGLGFLRARSRLQLFPFAPVGLAILVAFVLAFPVQIDRTGGDLLYFGALNESRSGLPIWLTLPLIFLAVAAVMATIGQGVARTFVSFDSLDAYRLDVLGSIAGIVFFSLLSFLGAPPVAWGLVVAVTLVVLYRPRVRWFQLAAAAALVAMLGVESLTPLQSWSPYYRVTLQPESNGTTSVMVNGIPHQTIESAAQRRQTVPLYFLPYERTRVKPRSVLIVGAGTGTDVAIALAEGAEHVDAVEIDPRLRDLGAQLHPDHPYQDPRVASIVDDGRAYLERTTLRYDLILFALPDSLTLVAGQSSLRLESYLFTVEAMRAAAAHLNPGGVFAEYNYYREQWLVDRLAGMLEDTYRQPPCIDSTGQLGRLALLTASLDPASLNCPLTWRSATNPVPAPAADDYPFLYLQSRALPSLYVMTLGLILVTALLAAGVAGGSLPRMGGYADLFFMGAAFLLLETKNVVQFALLFGTTWFVNALVFTGILLAVLAAIEVSRRIELRRPGVLYALLLGALAVAWLVPPDVLLQLPAAPRFLAATLLAFVPIFLANLIFAQRFRSVASSSVAFGANLVGAMVGGVLEYAALLTGYRALLMVVALLYALALLLSRTKLVRTPTA